MDTKNWTAVVDTKLIHNILSTYGKPWAVKAAGQPFVYFGGCCNNFTYIVPKTASHCNCAGYSILNGAKRSECNLLFSVAFGQVCLRSAQMMQAPLVLSLSANSLCFVSFIFSGRRKKERNEGKIFYYHTNHLGSTAYVTDQSQNVTQGFLYAPFGEITTEYNANFGSDIIPKYSFNAKELDEETGMYYYEARYYKPPVFTSRDAMMEQKPWLSPYHYCSNNPVGRVDPSGMLDDDYFNKDGNYLGSDDAQTDNVRIISQSDWDANKTVDVNGNATIDHAVGNEQSQMFSGASLEMTEAAQLAVYNHYNTTGLKIFSHKKNSSMTTYMSSDGTASIGINLKKNRGEGGVDICNRANEIINTFVHEKDHFERHRKNPQEYNNTPEWLREHWAIKAQLKDPSWEKVSYKYRKSVRLYDKECDSQVWCNIK